MDVVGSFKFIFLIFQISGGFPFRLERNAVGKFTFVESALRLLVTKIVFVVFVFLGIGVELYNFHVNLNFYHGLASNAVLIASCTFMVMSNLVAFLLVLKENKSLLMWLNKLNDMFSHVTESVLKLVKWYFGLSITTTITWIFASYAAQILLGRQKIFEKYLIPPSLQYLIVMLYYLIVWEIKIQLQLFLMFVILIRGYHKEVHKMFRNRFRKSHRHFWLKYLREVRVKNLEVKDLLDFLHVVFIPTIFLMFLWTICTVLFNMTVATKIGIPAGIQVIWMFYLLSDTFLTVFACHLAESAAKKTAHLVHQSLIESDDRDVKREVSIVITIELLSLQIQHENFEFNALGFSKINNNMLFSMVSWLASNTLILLQFQNDIKQSC